MKQLRRLMARSEKRGTYKTIGSLVFRARHIPIALVPPLSDYRSAKQISSKGYLQQGLERLLLLLKYRFEPSAYYTFGLFESDRYPRSESFVTHRQLVNLLAFLCVDMPIQWSADKSHFIKHCSSLGIRTPRLFGIWDTLEEPQPRFIEELKKGAIGEGVFFKPTDSGCGQGAGVLQYLEHGDWKITSSWSHTKPLSLDQVRGVVGSQARHVLFQQRIASHPIIAQLGGCSLHTVRIVTFQNQGGFQPLIAALRIGHESLIVDNFAQGGIAAGVDLETGKLVAGAAKATDVPPISITSVGQVDDIRTIQIPYWEDVVNTACAIHESLPTYHSLGHDIAIAPDGVVAIEINHGWDGKVVQKANDKGLGETAFPQTVFEFLRQKNEGAVR